MSRNGLLLVTGILVAWGAWNHFTRETAGDDRPSVGSVAIAASPADAVLVYGRDRCGYTRSTLASLRESGVPVVYRNLDQPGVNEEFHARFGPTGLGGNRGYALPVVEVAGRASMRPDPVEVARRFRNRPR